MTNGGTMRNCPQCGTPLMGGWCPVCHPNQQNLKAYKWWAAGQGLQSLGCLIMLVVFVIIPMCVLLYACATA